MGKLRDLSDTLKDRHGQLVHVHLTQDEKWRWPVRVDEVSPFLIDALVEIEDQRFWWHPGVDPLALCRALGQWIVSGRVVSGGSTLTMQTAKLLSPGPRTLKRKIIEIFRAVQLEWHYSKKEILSFYLTLAPYGKNIEGLGAGAYYFLGKSPQQLTVAETAMLVAQPQNPNQTRPDRYPEKARQQRNRILQFLKKRFREKGMENDLECALREDVRREVHAFPQHAYHLSHRLKSYSGRRSSLDFQTQKQIELIAQQHLAQRNDTESIAILVVDNRTRAVKAYVGSANPYNRQACGYVDMVCAVRSPGSTLKPFVYGLAFEEGWLKPQTILSDRPQQFGTYVPTNFMDRFHGPVSVIEALQQSLNVPVVSVLNRLGPRQFYYWLESFGIKLALPQSKLEPTLAIGLGGVGISLEHLVSLYAALAGDGTYATLSYDAESVPVYKRFMKQNTAHQITHILRSAPPPPGYAPKTSDMILPIAFKTGTSYGHRDAWCIGYSAQYTVGVWTGRPDGTPVAAQMGRVNAAPIVFQIFSFLEPAPEPWSLLPFDNEKVSFTHKSDQSLTITFPYTDSVLMYDAQQPFKLSIRGGEGPFSWIVNQEPVVVNSDAHEIVWQPPSPGFYDVTVIDQQGQSARVSVQVSDLLR